MDVARLRSASSASAFSIDAAQAKTPGFDAETIRAPLVLAVANVLARPAPPPLLTVPETDGRIKAHQTFTASQTRPQQTHSLPSEGSVHGAAAHSCMRAQTLLRQC